MKTTTWIILYLLLVSAYSRGHEFGGSPACKYSQAEYSELLQTMVFLSCKREEPLPKRMVQLPAYHNLLLQSWMMSEERSVLAAQNAIGSSTPMNLMDNWPEVEKEFTEARRSALQKIKGRKSTDGERRERTEYWDRLAEAALQLLHEHISAQLHSTAFVSGALNTVQWLVVSDDEDAKAYDQLGEVMTNTKEEQLRHGILKALILFSKRHPDVFESFPHDSDIRVSQLSLYWLVTSGQSNFLPSYVHQTWRLYGSGLDSPKPIVVVARDLPSLLLELIPESGSLFSEQSQLQWLEKNLVKLQWDKANKIYSLKEEKKQNR